MKKRNIRLLLLSMIFFTFVNAALAGSNVMLITHETTDPGEEIQMELVINNDDDFTGFQVDIVLPESFTYIPGSAQLNPDRRDGHNMTANVLAGNVLRIVAFSFSNNLFAGNEGPVVFFNLQTADMPGLYQLPLQNAIISNVNAENIITQTLNGSVTLNPGTNVMLIPDTGAEPGTQALIEVEINNEDEFTGFQVDVLFPEPLTYVPGSAELNPDRADGHTLSAVLQGDQTLRITAFSFANNLFSGNEGTVVSFLLQTTGADGTYNLQLEDAIISNVISFNLLTDTQDGTLTVSHDVTPQNLMLIPQYTAFTGEIITLALEIANHDQFSGFQTDILIPEGFVYVDESAVINQDRATDHTISASLQEGNVLRLTSFSMGNELFLGNSGPVAFFQLQSPETPGLFPIPLHEAFISDTDGNNIITGTSDGSVNLQSESQLVLQNMTIEDGETVCFQATETITLAGNDTYFIVQPGASLNLIAGESITMLPGTHIMEGSFFHAWISTERMLCLPDDEPAASPADDLLAGSGIQENATLFTVYPNPTQGVFNIRLSETNPGLPMMVEVFGIAGNKIISKELQAQTQQTIDIGNTQPGIYLVRVIHDGKVHVERIYKR